jgi:hypothetical protein
VSWKAEKKEVRSRTVRQVAEVPLAGADPIRVFSWARTQRHRPGLEYMVSTGRLGRRVGEGRPGIRGITRVGTCS